MLELSDGSHVRIDSVRTGALIRTAAGYEPVTARMHADRANSLDYFELSTASAKVAISENHWLVLNGVEAPPSSARVGDLLSTPRGDEAITSIERRRRRGLYHIEVASGQYYADDLLVSTYVAECPRLFWRIFADGYAWLRYTIGLHIIPDGEGALPLFWALRLYQTLGVPAFVVTHVLWPFTMGTVLLTEAINTVLHHCTLAMPAAVGAVALSATFGKGMRSTA